MLIVCDYLNRARRAPELQGKKNKRKLLTGKHMVVSVYISALFWSNFKLNESVEYNISEDETDVL